MAVPSNPVRIFHSGNLGAQRIEAGKLDLINVLKQVVAGTFTDIISISTQLNGTKVLITCLDPHKLYPYQVLKLSGTGTPLEGKEFFVINDSTFTASTFSIDLGADAVALPNVITMALPTLGWTVVEDSASWFSFRPSFDARIPVCRISKTVPTPVVGARRVYSTYLAKDVNLDGLTMKNYTSVGYIGDDGLNQDGNMGLGTGWMVIADKQFIYFTTNRNAKGYYGTYDLYSLFSPEKSDWLCNSAVCYTFGIPSLWQEDLPMEAVTIYNPSTVDFKDNPTSAGAIGNRGHLSLTSIDDGEFVTARNPQDFQGLTGVVQACVNYMSGVNGLPYPPFGSHNTLMAQIPLQIKGKGVFGIMRGCRAYLSHIGTALAYASEQTSRYEHHIKPNSFHMGLVEMGTLNGALPMVNIVGSKNGNSGWHDQQSAVYGIRVGCSWDVVDTQGVF